VGLERARRRELAELVPDHVLAHEHRDVLTAVVNGDREADHLGQHHRTARPGLDGFAIVLGLRHLHLLHEMQIDERTLLR
jgi:hypothetical protein